MKAKSAALILAFTFLGEPQVMGQWFGPNWLSGTEITAQDRATISATVKEKIHGRRVGTIASWSNPVSGHFGTIRLLSKSEYQRMPCERIEYKIRSSKPHEPAEDYTFRSCRLPNGSWKLAG